MKPEDVHPSHNVVDEGYLVTEPVCHASDEIQIVTGLE